MNIKTRLATAASVIALLAGGGIAAAAPAQAATYYAEEIGYHSTSAKCWQRLWSREREIRNAGGIITKVNNACNTHHRATIYWHS